MEIPDITKLTWPLNVAIVGATFSIFALIYNVSFIYYGFLTFIYGILCHLVDTTYGFWLKDQGVEPKYALLSQIILTGLWIVLLLKIYRYL